MEKILTAEDKLEKLQAEKEAELKNKIKERQGSSYKDYLEKIHKKLKKEKKDGVISFEELEKSLKKETKVMDAAKGGEVKKYKKGGSVRKNKSNMITTRGWGASRKT